jgi:hypothetical protein
VAELDEDAEFFDAVGIRRPRTGPAGVTRGGGVGGAGMSPPTISPVPQPSVNKAPVGRPAEPPVREAVPGAPLPIIPRPTVTPRIGVAGPAPGPTVMPQAPGTGLVVNPTTPGQSDPGRAPTTAPRPNLPPPATTALPAPAPSPAPVAVAQPQPAAQPAPAAAPAQPAPAAPQTAEVAPAITPPQVQFSKMPSRLELEGVQPGTVPMTPYGPITIGADGKQEIQFTPEGKVAWATEVNRMQKDYGPTPVGGDPNAPKPRVTPGKQFYNPFTDTWGS